MKILKAMSLVILFTIIAIAIFFLIVGYGYAIMWIAERNLILGIALAVSGWIGFFTFQTYYG